MVVVMRVGSAGACLPEARAATSAFATLYEDIDD